MILQGYVNEVIKLSKEGPEKVRQYIEERSEIGDYNIMLLHGIVPDIMSYVANTLCDAIAESIEPKNVYRAVRNYIISLIKKLKREVDKSESPHLKGYLREVLSELYEVLSRVHQCSGKKIDYIIAKADALKFRGLALKTQGYYDKALNIFKEAIKVASDFLESEINKGRVKYIERLINDLNYMAALKCETLAQLCLYKGKIKEAITLLKVASEHYDLANDRDSLLWTQGFAYALEGLLKLYEGDVNDAMKSMTHIYSNIYPKVRDLIEGVLTKQDTTLDRLFAASLIGSACRIAYDYWKLLGVAYELLLNIYYKYLGYTSLPRTIEIRGKVIEVDLNAIKYQEKLVHHVIGESKTTLNGSDVRKFAKKVNIISSYIKENPTLCPKGYRYELQVIIVANFAVSTISRGQVKAILSKCIKEKCEVVVWDVKELEDFIKKVTPELTVMLG